ncbi:hypothetical protein [Scytonema sp. NUACC26]
MRKNTEETLVRFEINSLEYQLFISLCDEKQKSPKDELNKLIRSYVNEHM